LGIDYLLIQSPNDCEPLIKVGEYLEMITFCFGPIVQFGPELAQKWSPSQAQQRTTRTRHNVRTTNTCSGRGGHARVAPTSMDACLAALPSVLLLQKGRTEPMRSLSTLLRALSLSVHAGHGGAPLVAIAGRRSRAPLPPSLLPTSLCSIQPKARSCPARPFLGVAHPPSDAQAARRRSARPQATDVHGWKAVGHLCPS
jgi:hypothetical protein